MSKTQPKELEGGWEVEKSHRQAKKTLTPSSFVRRPQWLTQTLRNVEEYFKAPKSTFRESMLPKKLQTYMALMSSIIDFKPSSFQGEAN